MYPFVNPYVTSPKYNYMGIMFFSLRDQNGIIKIVTKYSRLPIHTESPVYRVKIVDDIQIEGGILRRDLRNYLRKLN